MQAKQMKASMVERLTRSQTIRIIQSRKQLDKRGFAGPILSHQCYTLARTYYEAYIL